MHHPILVVSQVVLDYVIQLAHRVVKILVQEAVLAAVLDVAVAAEDARTIVLVDV